MNEGESDRRTEPSWDQVATGFAELGDLIGSEFSGGKEGDAPAANDLRQAWRSFVSAAQDLGQALALTVNDPDVRAGTKRAVTSLVDAVGATVRDTARKAAGRARPGRDTENGESATKCRES